MIVQVRDRDGVPFVLPSSLSLRPLRYRTDAQGGHVFATLRADADGLALWRLIGWLRYRVEIHDNLGIPVWWGYIHSVNVSTGGVGVGISLDSMANRVACIWSNDDTGGTTTWAEDTTSTNAYGDKELLISASGVTETAAEQRRDWELARRKYPSPALSPGQNDIQYAIIECRGWIQSTAWTYYERDEGLTEYVPSNSVAQRMGWGFTSSELGFTARGGFVAEASAYLSVLEKGEKFRVSGSSSNNSAFTVESSSDREPDSVTATSIAFLQQEKTATAEYMRASHDVARKLNNSNLKTGSVVVTNEGASTTYTITTDYTVDLTDGTLTALSTGAITNNQVLKVSYIYTEYRIEDANLGLAFVNANDTIEIDGSSLNDGYYRVVSTGLEGDRVTVRETVTAEGPGASITIARGANIVVEETPTDELPGSSATVYGYGWRLAQSFQIDSDEGWDAYTVEIKANRVGSPIDNLRVRIFTDSTGAPGSSLESSTVVGSSISTQTGWVTFAFTGASLSTSTTYWLVVDRTGSASPTNYYQVSIDEDQLYADGSLLVSDGTAWQTRPGGGDMPFRILGLEATTTQITELVDQEAQFLTGVDIIDTSGVNINQYREGRNTAYDELMNLLEIGTTNDVRLLATVTRDLVLRVEEEPAQPATADYVLTTEGIVRTKLGQALIDGHMDFVGKWVEIPDLPPTAEFEYINTPTPFLAESAEYDVERKRYTIQPRGAEPVWRVGMSIDEG